MVFKLNFLVAKAKINQLERFLSETGSQKVYCEPPNNIGGMHDFEEGYTPRFYNLVLTPKRLHTSL